MTENMEKALYIGALVTGILLGAILGNYIVKLEENRKNFKG